MGTGHVESTQLQTVGWREWLALPELGVPAIKAKLDTGARTSALHAVSQELFQRGGEEWVRFVVHPMRRRRDIAVEARAPVVDRRVVSDSSGRRRRRVYIRTLLSVNQVRWPIEISLTDRETMLFPMLLGRTAMAGRLVLDPGHSYWLGRPSRHLLREYPPGEFAQGPS